MRAEGRGKRVSDRTRKGIRAEREVAVGESGKKDSRKNDRSVG